MDSRQKLQARYSLIYVVGAVLAVLLLQEYVIGPMTASEEEVPYSQFRQDLAAGAIAEVTVEPERILYTVSDSGDETAKKRRAVRIEDDDLVEELVDAGVEFQARTPQKGLLGSLLGWILPVLPFVLIWWLLMK
ncbi:MAG: ATP-dependent metallopeptidase FtsH/Yme1/Tma family protein, partial [Thermoanaerobaculia bacterium]